MKVLSVFTICCLTSSALFAAQLHQTDPVTAAQSWEAKQDGVYLYINQLLPDQVRAFYSNRGFSLSHIESYATSCVFMAVLRNESASGVIRYQTKNWSVERLKNENSIKPVDEWLQEYKLLDVKKPALIAFRWAQFPLVQDYEPGGDWNQGMLSLGENSNAFNLIARWTLNSKPYQIKLKGVSCAQ